MPPEDFEIQFLTEVDRPWMMEFLAKNFCKDEPITDYLKITEDPVALQSLKKFITKNLYQNLSFGFLDKTGQVVGVCINSVHTRNDPEDEPDQTLFGTITRFLGYGYEQAKVFDKFPDVEKVMYMDVISVNKDHAGKGIGTLMIERAKEVARNNSLRMIRVDCTSYFSARVSEKLGMECVYELKYEDYKENGAQVFNPDPPHTGLKVYVQMLE